MPGRYSKFISALTILVSLQAQAASEVPPCAINVDVKAPEWITSCEAAIARESDVKRRAPLLFGRAYYAVEQFRYDDAIADLNAALAADPDNPAYLRERAYVHGELSNLDEAIGDLDRVIAQKPKEAYGYRERAYARHYRGDLKGAYEDRAREFELTPDSLDALVARGRAALWLGRFDDAKADATRARAGAKVAGNDDVYRSASELLSHIALWRDTTRGADAAKVCSEDLETDKSDRPKLIGDCSRAFLEAKTGVAKADALTSRSTAWLVAEDSQNESTGDLRLALAFDPANVARYINLGYSFLMLSHSWAAKLEFDRALALDKHWLALAGRAAARLNLGDKEGALADARASNELHPNNEAAAGVLADERLQEAK